MSQAEADQAVARMGRRCFTCNNDGWKSLVDEALSKGYTVALIYRVLTNPVKYGLDVDPFPYSISTLNNHVVRHGIRRPN